MAQKFRMGGRRGKRNRRRNGLVSDSTACCLFLWAILAVSKSSELDSRSKSQESRLRASRMANVVIGEMRLSFVRPVLSVLLASQLLK